MGSDQGRNGDERDQLRVVIASDVRLYRDGLARILSDQPGLTLAGTAPLALAAERIGRLQPNVLLVDGAAVRDGHLVREVTASSPETLVVAFAVAERADEVVACAEAGAAAYVPLDASVEELVGILTHTADGELQCSPRIASSVFRRVGALAANGQTRTDGPALTAREHEVGQLLAEGLSNKQIARRLSIQISTVKHHVHRVLEKLGVRHRTEAAMRVRDRRRR